MNIFKRLAIPVIAILVLVSAAFAASGPWTMPHSHGTSRSPLNFPYTITTIPQYKASLVMNMSEPWGLGIGTLGDYVLANSFFNGKIVVIRNGRMSDVADGLPWVEGGRMWGKYYFGTNGGGVFSLDGNGVVTTLSYPYSTYVDVYALDVDHATGAVYYALTDMYDGIVYFCRWVPGRGTEPLFSEDIGPCYGLAIKGNYIYFSVPNTPEFGVIFKTDKRGGGPLIQVVSGLLAPEDIIFDAKGNLFIAESDAESISLIKAGTTKVTHIAWGIPGINGLGIDKAGDVFFSMVEMGAVWKLKKLY